MTTLRREECSILPLVLKGRWYDMIESGEKKEEYRDISPFWDARIRNWRGRRWFPGGYKKMVVAFSRGYRKPGMYFLTDFAFASQGVHMNMHREWGEPETPHWIITLLERVGITEGD